ncbi:hypothetical protein [Geoalkalibacter halelectricus]|uniref:hypothetical protein n=1 Tax=Geoalkalibacter halelectricus TaxID=2847045 RepID=UPI003D243CAD
MPAWLTPPRWAVPTQVMVRCQLRWPLTDWDAGSRERGGDFNFDTFRLNLDGEIKDMILSAEYRFYPSDDWHAPKHAWIGYNFTDDLQGQIGVHQVPFGLLPYASHNFWFSGAYYVGLEDDYDMGIKFLYNQGPWDLALAFYKNEELGNAGNAGRYSVDVISNADGGFAGAQPAGNRETNQFNLRLAHTLDHGALGTTELGGSGQWGQLYNSGTGKTGDHWAGALHLNGNYGRWNLQLQWARYEHNPKNPDEVELADGTFLPIRNDIITMGAYSFSWGVPAKADIAIANLAYTQPVNWGPISSLTFYSDNTLIEPDKDRFNSIWQNVVGCMIAAGPVFTYVDVISGKNMIFSGGDMVGGAGNEGRTTRVNVNFGYYF